MRHISMFAVFAFAACGSDDSHFFQPDFASASSEWSDNYLIDYAIDGSGLPSDFGPENEHAAYRHGNHWSTEDGDVQGAWAEFGFDGPMTIDTFYLWNHRSTSPPAFSDSYAITRFDLLLFDSERRLLAEHQNLSADRNRADAQIYGLESTDDVRSVRLIVRENAGEPRVTGLAEVGFGGYQ